MGGGTASKLESAAMALASLALAGAVGFAALAGSGQISVAAGAAVVAAALCWAVLTRVGRGVPEFPVTTFDLGAIHVVRPETLELTQVYREPLELDDVLENVGPGARVVRLFDPAAMPSPGELRQRIEHHLGRGTPGASPDASQALIEALTQLRQSLR
jgi:hypothetical protein